MLKLLKYLILKTRTIKVTLICFLKSYTGNTDFKMYAQILYLYNIDFNISSLVLLQNDIKVIEVTQANSVHMLWLIPQYVIITAGEIMFSITGLEFSYSQAPVTMKSFLQACWLLTTAIGNAIIVVIESAKIFEKQVISNWSFYFN